MTKLKPAVSRSKHAKIPKYGKLVDRVRDHIHMGNQLKIVDFRIPEPGDLYLDKRGKLHRADNEVKSSRSHYRMILKEGWL